MQNVNTQCKVGAILPPVLAIFATLSISGDLQLARAEVIDNRPYPLLEFFLADECVVQDVEVTTLIQALVLSTDTTPDALLGANQLVSQARRDCAAGRISKSLANYDAAIARLCNADEFSTARSFGHTR